MTADDNRPNVIQGIGSNRGSGAGLSSEDVRKIVKDENSSLKQAVGTLTDTIREESKERKEESRELNKAIITMTKAITEVSQDRERIDDRFKHVEEKHDHEMANIYRQSAEITDRLDHVSGKLDEVAKVQVENKSKLVIMWGLAGGSVSIIAFLVSIFYGMVSDSLKEQNDNLADALVKVAESVHENSGNFRELIRELRHGQPN